VVVHRRLNEAYRLELDTKSWRCGALANQPLKQQSARKQQSASVMTS
jgi:hypothetical protein